MVSRSPSTHFILLWLAGNSLRVTVLAVPPVLPSIHHDLHLDEKTVGAVTGLPVLLLGLGAVWGSLLIAHFGARRTFLLGLGLLAVAGAVRGLGPTTPVLFVMTFLMGVGVSVSQPTLPSLVRKWIPENIGRATSVYANGLVVGEILAASLTTQFILPLVGHRWEYALLVWSLPVLATAIAIAAFTTEDARSDVPAVVRWWPDWRNGLTWRLGLVLGCASAAYFASNAFIPDYLKATHRAEYVPAALISINLLQLPASVLVGLMPHRLIGNRWPLAAAGLGMAVAAFGFRMEGPWVVGWAGLMGFCSATVLVLSLALPPLLADPGDVHRLTAAVFTITYLCPFVASLAGGAAWDITGIPITSFFPISIAGVALIVLVSRMDLSRARWELRRSGGRDPGL